MHPDTFGWPRIHVDSIESTMPTMTRLARLGAPSGIVLSTDFQSSGTGRDRRPWLAPAGSALLISVLVKTQRPIHETSVISLLIGNCVAETLDDVGVASSIKWPNDVLVRGRKICGILVRSSPSTSVSGLDLIIGIGLNLTTGSTEGLASATNVERETGAGVSRSLILDRLLRHIGSMTESFEGGSSSIHLAQVRNRLAMTGEQIVITSGESIVRGVIQGVRDDGALIVIDEMGQCVFIVSGELQRGPIGAGGPA